MVGAHAPMRNSEVSSGGTHFEGALGGGSGPACTQVHCRGSCQRPAARRSYAHASRSLLTAPPPAALHLPSSHLMCRGIETGLKVALGSQGNHL